MVIMSVVIATGTASMAYAWSEGTEGTFIPGKLFHIAPTVRMPHLPEKSSW